MIRDPRTPSARSFDDESIGLLVRDVAAGWTMPAVRLDAPSWRDRVRGRRVRLLRGIGLAGGTLVRAATTAAALTVVAALLAVIITGPQQPASTPDPTGEPTAGAVEATPLPRLLLNGEAPFPSRILVANDGGDIALVDLAAGTLGGSIARAQWPSAMTVTANGLVVCVCITASDPVDGFPTRLDVRLKTFTRATTPIQDTPVRELVGGPDPRIPVTRADHVWTSVWFSPDDRSAFVGWSTRVAPVWRSGLTVVDIATGSITGEVLFPDMTAGDGDARRTVGAPRVLGLGSGASVLLARSWAEWGSANVDTEPTRVGDDGYTAMLAGDGAVGELVPLAADADCGPSLDHAGPLPGAGFWLACVSNVGTYTVRRVGEDGAVLGTESMPRTGFIDGDTTAVSPDGSVFYAWDPGSATITRVDLATGARASQRLDVTAALVDPLTAVGRLLAPPADAKSVLRGAILVSPDGARLYLLGTQPIVDERQPTGSTGVLVVDAATLQVVDHWPPTADFVSIALNGDGSLLYAAGLPGVDASGASSLAQGASITVFDTATGQQRLIAGQLGQRMLSFPKPVVP